MNNQLKQRLVGAIVLVALAVIFIPMLLPGKGDLSGGIHGSNIPPEPDFRFPPVPAAPEAPPVAEAPTVPMGDDAASDKHDAPEQAEPKQPVEPPAVVVSKPESKPESKASSAPKKAASQPASSPAVKSSPTKQTPVKAKPGSVTAWVVQVGSFSDSKNALALRDKLRHQGFVSFVEDLNTKSGRVYRVRVGPELSNKAAEQMRQRLAKEAGLKGLVQVYP